MSVLSASEFAKRLGLTPQAVAYWIRKGQLKAEKHGNTWIITEADAEAFQRPPTGRPKRSQVA